MMDFGIMLSDSFDYAKEAVMGKWIKWILLVIPFMTQGYSVQVFKGTKPAPEINDWVGNFINGIKLFIIGFVYVIPLIIVAVIFLLGAILAGIGGISKGDFTAGLAAALGAGLVGLLICVILLVIILIILPMAYVRFARTDSFGEAFNVSAVFAHIGKIGWVSYILALIVGLIAIIILEIIIAIPYIILMLIPVVGFVLALIWSLLMSVPVGIFIARYTSQIYDSAAA